MTEVARDGSHADPHSYARPLEARVRHLSCDLSVDFDTQQLEGRVRLDLDVAPHGDTVVLDTSDLTIHAVTDADGRALDYQLGARGPDSRASTVDRVARPLGGRRRIRHGSRARQRCNGCRPIKPPEACFRFSIPRAMRC